MKRLLISLATAVALLPAVAQTNTNPGAKVDPKNNKVGKPVVDKPKPVLMSRDELRACMQRNDDNVKEAEVIKQGQASYKEATAELLKEKDALQKLDEANAAENAAGKQERDAILKMFEDIKAAAPKMEKAEYEAKQKEYQARAAAFDARISTLNESIKASAARRKVFGDKVDVVNASFKSLEERTETHFDKTDAYKKDCANKRYDEADELAINKEKAAAGK